MQDRARAMLVNLLSDHFETPPARPAVSVLMSVYNESPPFLERAVHSILKQSFHDLEFVILDDGSDKEDTRRSLLQIAEQDRRIRLFIEPHRGLTNTLNRGLSLCRGELICRQDSDDWSEACRLARQVSYLQRNSAIALVGSFAWFHQEDGTRLWVRRVPTTAPEIAQAFHKSNPFIHGSVCFRRKAFEEVGCYRAELNGSEDRDAFWRLCDRFAGANLPEPLYHYRFKRVSVSAAGLQQREKRARIIRHLAAMRQNSQPEDMQLASRKATERAHGEDTNTSHLFIVADRLMLAGYRREALQRYLHAIGRCPFGLIGWLKLVRLGLFLTVPRVRPWLFKGHRP
jgi:glycosyltransferase involved in cell wall biosynthesis